MLELLKRAGYLETHVKFVNDVQYSGRRGMINYFIEE
jgi:hypothetical protein